MDTGSIIDEWVDLDAQTAKAAARVMHDLDEEERLTDEVPILE